MATAPDLTPAFYDAWTAAMRRLGVDPLDVARVAYAETGMFQRHPRNAKIGIFPFTPSTLRAMGWTGTPEEFTAQSPEDQVPWVERYLAPHARFLTNDGLVYVVTFLPAKLPAAAVSDDDFVLTRRGDATRFYEQNAILDRNGDGEITVGDLRSWLLTQDRGSRYQDIEANLKNRGASGSSGGDGGALVQRSGLHAFGRTVPWAVVGGLGVLGAWWWLYNTRSGAPTRRSLERGVSSFTRKLA